MAAGTYHAGNKATVTVGGAEQSTIGWSVNHSVGLQEFRNSKTNSVATNEATWNNFDVNLIFEYDFASNPFSGPKLYAGKSITNVICYMNGSSNATDGFTFPKLTVVSSPVQVNVEGKIGYSVNCRPNGGPITLPGGESVS
jgi:hypothetical protein